MAEPNLYDVLGVSPSASLDEIKAAYRELVKKYHPDLFANRDDKQRANEKLLEINQAYAVLGDPARRRDYDERRAARRAAPTSAVPHPPRRSRSPGTEAARTRAAASFRSAVRRPRFTRADLIAALSPRRWRGVFSRRAALLVLAGLAVLVVAYAMREQPQTVLAWTLLSETVVEPQARAPGAKAPQRNWMPEGSYASRSECVAALKDMVQRDERQGGRAVIDERLGTIGITVHVRDEAALAREYFEKRLQTVKPGDAPVDDRELLRQAKEEAREFIRKNGLTRRVRNYECRPTRVIERDSWWRRKLRNAGLLS